ncbi:hypothetical protein LTR84_010486 [Exophiala bonariae]|uniref:RecA family profile 1 domain-containing protein n=1 Tax=Exophiala bonariae TaxID=1690606 RepID=A0AAV9MTH2_9EURO|nr:hypothetical protein LTR84_010486 [Exophiala bonariae]
MDDQEPDVHNFSTSSEHRLPTISGADALQNASIKSKGIPTSLPSLDETLQPSNNPLGTAGLQIGHVTEIFGPPGVGKTAFGLQLAVNAIRSRRDDSRILWVNTGSPLIEQRLMEINAALVLPSLDEPPSSPPQDTRIGDEARLEDKFDYLEISSFPRLLTLFLHPTPDLPTNETCLIVIDDFSNFILGSFSKDAAATANIKTSAPVTVQEKLTKKAAAKRFQVIESLATSMSKLAALRNLAIVVLTGTTTNLKVGEHRGVLTPALASQAWESAVHTRIMLYRDFPPDDLDVEPDVLEQLDAGLRYADVQKLARKEVYTPPTAFIITTGGLQEVNLPDTTDYHGPMIVDGNQMSERPSEPDLPPLPLEIGLPERSRKRSFGEIADSEDEGSDSLFGNEDGNDIVVRVLDDENDEKEEPQHDDDYVLTHHDRNLAEVEETSHRYEEDENEQLVQSADSHIREHHEYDLPRPESAMSPAPQDSAIASDDEKTPLSCLSSIEEHANTEHGDSEEEMLLGRHATLMPQDYGSHGEIRGSEDMVPRYSSDGEVADSEEEDEEDVRDNG